MKTLIAIFQNKRVEVKVVRGFLVSLAVLGLAGILSFVTIFRLLGANQQVEQTQRVLRQLELVLSEVKDAETGQRGYLLTAQESYLQPYYAAVANVNQEIDKLRNLTSANPIQQSRVLRLEALINSKMAELKQTVELAKSQDVAAALAVVQTNQGKMVMDNIRTEIEAIENSEENSLSQHLDESKTTAITTLILLPATAVIAMAILTLAIVTLIRDNRQRRLAEVEVRNLNNTLETRIRERTAQLQNANQRNTAILESITDAFFVVDKNWLFSFLNPQAEMLLQHSKADLLGKNIWQQFPEAVGSAFYDEYHLAVEQHIAVNFQAFYPPFNSWFDVRAYPSEEGLSVYFQDISLQKQLEQAREIELRRQTALSMVALAVNSPAELSEVVASVVKIFWQELKGASASIFLLSNDNQSINGLVGIGFASGDIAAMGVALTSLPHTRQAIEQQRSVFFTLNEATSGELQYFETFSFVSSLVTPLLVNAAPIGVAYVNYDEPSLVLDEGQLNFARDLANQCALAINKSNLLKERGELLDEVQRRANELEQQVQEVQNALRLRDAFINIAAHELRTPLTSLKMMVQLAQREMTRRPNNEYERVLQSLNKSLTQFNRLERLIDDMVETTNIIEGWLKLDTERLNLIEIVQTAINSEFVFDENQAIEFDCEVAEIPILADRRRINHVFRNLLDNAIKFSQNDSPIRVKIYADPTAKSAIINIHNLGVTIPLSDREAIFLPYFQADSDYRSRRYGGLGLGLFVSKAIINAHNGQLELTESNDQTGTTFVVTLPIYQ